MLSFADSFYTLDTSHLSDTCFAKMPPLNFGNEWNIVAVVLMSLSAVLTACQFWVSFQWFIFLPTLGYIFLGLACLWLDAGDGTFHLVGCWILLFL